MEMIRGRTLAEVRRYDLLKLLIAALLFINALFFCGGARQVVQSEAAKPTMAATPAATVPAPPVPAAAVSASPTAPLAVAQPAVAPQVVAPPIVAPTAAVLAKPANAKVFFANNQSQVTAESTKGLAEVIAWGKAGPANKLAVSGFHSASGNAERNHELAKARAREVASILLHAGVSEAQIEMRKPVQELGGVDAAQARRVEVGPAN